MYSDSTKAKSTKNVNKSGRVGVKTFLVSASLVLPRRSCYLARQSISLLLSLEQGVIVGSVAVPDILIFLSQFLFHLPLFTQLYLIENQYQAYFAHCPSFTNKHNTDTFRYAPVPKHNTFESRPISRTQEICEKNMDFDPAL